jgi:hypothetical protein
MAPRAGNPGYRHVELKDNCPAAVVGEATLLSTSCAVGDGTGSFTAVRETRPNWGAAGSEGLPDSLTDAESAGGPVTEASTGDGLAGRSAV